ADRLAGPAVQGIHGGRHRPGGDEARWPLRGDGLQVQPPSLLRSRRLPGGLRPRRPGPRDGEPPLRPPGDSLSGGAPPIPAVAVARLRPRAPPGWFDLSLHPGDDRPRHPGDRRRALRSRPLAPAGGDGRPPFAAVRRGGIVNDRIALAAQDPNVVVHAHGLLAEFNEAGVLAPVDVASAQAVSRLLGETDEAVTLAAALAVRGTRFGHVCVRVPTLRESVVVDGREAELVEALPWPEPDEWLERLRSSSLVGDGSGEHPLVLSDDRLYLERYWRYEQQVAGLIRDRLGRGEAPLAPATEETLRRLLAEDGETTQFRAARVALASKLAVIAGGPGTGKTYAVGAMLVALAAAGAETFPLVGLCAPTGKAAARLGQAITELARDVGDPAISAILEQVTPQTIHRLLGWAWGRSRFRHDGSNRLPHDIVIVDEMSMVSLPLAARLLAALRDDATLVIVGDPFQLESIEAGTVLADIVGPAADRPAADTAIAGKVTVLDRVYRFEEDSTIADFADAVRRGDPDDAV